MPQRPTLRREDAADDYYRDKFNRAGHVSANDIKNLENQYATSSDASDIDDIQNYANDSKNSSKNIDKTREKESSSDTGAWRQNYTGKDSQNKLTGKGMSKKKKWGITGGIGISLSGLIFAAFLAILPMKIEAFIQNISKKVDAVPEYAVKQRGTYLVTRAIAARMIQLDNPTHDTVFCKSGTIGCALMRTYTTNFIEKKYDLKFTKLGDEVKITPNGRTRLGGKATSWDVTYKRGESLDDLTKHFGTNKEAKQFLTDMLKEKEVGGVMKRYLIRKILMRKYGVTSWRGLEKQRAEYADRKTTIKAKMLKNTLGRISSRMGIYFGCINGGDTATCEKTINEIHGDSPEGDAAREKYLGAAEPTGDENAKAVEKFFSQKIITKAGSIVGLVLMGDMILHGLAAADNGSLDIVAQDMVANVDNGYAFGDDTGLVTNAEKVMAGDGDATNLGILTQTLDGATTSPLMQADNGISAPQFAALAGGGNQGMSCDSSFGGDPQPLPKGQMVCNNEKFVRGYSTMLHSIPGLKSLLSFADTYTNSLGGKAIHKIAETLGEITGWIISHTPGVSYAIKQVSRLLAGPLKAMMSFIFDPPFVGVGAPGGHNYVALRGALTNASNQTMEQGVDDQGKAMGGAGTVLTNQQVADIQSTEMKDTATSHTAIASLFNPYIEGSLTQQFILTAPTQPSTMLASLISLPSSLFSSLVPHASALDAGVAANPMGVIPYGYAENSSVFTANPDKYTQAYCDASAKAREDSLVTPAQMNHQYAVPVYTKSDPCALEKMTVGTLLTADHVTNNPYTLEDPGKGGVSGSATPTSQTTPTGPSNVPTGTAKSLATQILPYIQKGQLTCIYGPSNCPDIQDSAKGITIPRPCAVAALDPTLLGLILGLLQNGQSMQINAMCSNHPATSYGAGATVSMHNVGKAMDLGEVNGVRLWPNSTQAPPGVVKFYTALTQLVGGPDSPVHLVLNQGQCDGHGGLSMLNGYHVINTDYCHHQHLTVDDEYWNYSKKFTFPSSGLVLPGSKPGSYYGNA